MATPTKLELQQKIAKLEKGLSNKALSSERKSKLRVQIKGLKDDLAKMSKAKTPSERLAQAKALALKIRKTQGGVPTKKSDVEKDATRSAMKKVKRISQGLRANQYGDKSDNKGSTYYEYRENRKDRKPERYPKLADGGMMAKGGELDSVEEIREKVYDFLTPLGYSARVELVGGNEILIEPSTKKVGSNRSDYFDGMRIIRFSDGTYEVAEYQAGKNEDELHIYKETKSLIIALKDLIKGNKRKPIKKYADGGLLGYASGGSATSTIGGTTFSNGDLSGISNLDLSGGMFAHGGEIHRAEGGDMYAKGGMTQHGLQIGDMIIGHDDNSIVVKDRQGKTYMVNLNSGKRWEMNEWEQLSTREQTKLKKG